MRVVQIEYYSNSVELESSIAKIYEQKLWNVKPIPLTKEVLIKCGFFEDYGDFYLTVISKEIDCDHDYKVVIHADEELLKRGLGVNLLAGKVRCYDTPDPEIKGINLQYLHQIQNIYYDLTGKELEIKL